MCGPLQPPGPGMTHHVMNIVTHVTCSGDLDQGRGASGDGGDQPGGAQPHPEAQPGAEGGLRGVQVYSQQRAGLQPPGGGGHR